MWLLLWRDRLPESLGSLTKIQLWHNNAGASPSWFLSRVTVKDVNSGEIKVETQVLLDLSTLIEYKHLNKNDNTVVVLLVLPILYQLTFSQYKDMKLIVISVMIYQLQERPSISTAVNGSLWSETTERWSVKSQLSRMGSDSHKSSGPKEPSIYSTITCGCRYGPAPPTVGSRVRSACRVVCACCCRIWLWMLRGTVGRAMGWVYIQSTCWNMIFVFMYIYV